MLQIEAFRWLGTQVRTRHRRDKKPSLRNGIGWRGRMMEDIDAKFGLELAGVFSPQDFIVIAPEFIPAQQSVKYKGLISEL